MTMRREGAHASHGSTGELALAIGRPTLRGPARSPTSRCLWAQLAGAFFLIALGSSTALLGQNELDAPLRSSTAAVRPAAAIVVIPGAYSLSLDGDLAINGAIFKDAAPFVHNAGGPEALNTAIGWNALTNVTPGIPYPPYGYRNTAVGQGALFSNTSGAQNTAVGAYALNQTTQSYFNTAIGHRALMKNSSGISNTAVGDRALYNNTSGSANVAIGNYAQRDVTSGTGNTALGRRAGRDWTTGSNNIAIGSGVYGSPSDSGIIRIGGDDLQSQTFIEGIRDATPSVVVPFDQEVCISSQNRLGPCTPSSARFKTDVSAMGETTDLLDSLRPVTFRFESATGGDSPLHFGLLAEEVAKILPTLVSYDRAGEPLTVRYALLTPLLLNAVQRQRREIGRLRSQLEDRATEVEDRRDLEDLRRQIAALLHTTASQQRQIDELSNRRRLSLRRDLPVPGSGSQRDGGL